MRAARRSVGALPLPRGEGGATGQRSRAARWGQSAVFPPTMTQNSKGRRDKSSATLARL